MSNYTFVWGNTQGMFTIEGDRVSIANYRNIVWNRLNKVISIVRDNRISGYLSNEDITGNNERGKLWFDKDYVNDFFKEVKQQCKNHKSMLKKLKNADFSNLTNDEIYRLLEKALNQWAMTISYFRASQMEGTHYLTEKVTEIAAPDESAVLLLPSKLDPINKEQLDWWKIISKKYNVKKIVAHLHKYPWLAANHFSVDDAVRTLTERYEYDKKNLDITDIKAEKENLKKKQFEILKKYPKIREFVDILNKVALSRIELKSCWAGTDFYLTSLFKEVSKRTGEDIKDIWRYYLSNEVRDLLNGKKLSQEEKKKRKECFVSLWKGGKTTYISGREAEELAKTELEDLYELSDIKELKGMPANPGKIIGIARILEANNVQQLRELRKSFSKGDILITEMTQPAIVDIAKRAGAIVTDEGSMLSHAAIISREFKIPCIVGTHSATRIIKDGMKIEVDANNGIIRIL